MARSEIGGSLSNANTLYMLLTLAILLCVICKLSIVTEV